MSTAKLRLPIAGLSMVLLATAYSRLNSSAVMSEAATQFLNSLDAGQKAKASFPFTDDERINWHFVPFATPRCRPTARTAPSVARNCIHRRRPGCCYGFGVLPVLTKNNWRRVLP